MLAKRCVLACQFGIWHYKSARSASSNLVCVTHNVMPALFKLCQFNGDGRYQVHYAVHLLSLTLLTMDPFMQSSEHLPPFNDMEKSADKQDTSVIVDPLEVPDGGTVAWMILVGV